MLNDVGQNHDFSIPVVSIGMPAFNCARTLPDAVGSILCQTYENWELLIVDDGSSDETVGVARRFADPRIRVFNDGSHLGIGHRRNQTIALARGQYFALLDADDVAYPARLERQVHYLDRRADIDLVGCGIIVFKGDGTLLGTRRNPETHSDICARPWSGFSFAHSTWMGRLEWFRRHQYQTELSRVEDRDLLLRSYKTSRFASIPEILVGYREDSISLAKSVVSRYRSCKSILAAASAQEEYLAATWGIVGQVGKGIVDVLAVITNLRYWLLRHRALPVEEAIKYHWSEVWRELQRQTEGRAEPVSSQEWLCQKPV